MVHIDRCGQNNQILVRWKLYKTIKENVSGGERTTENLQGGLQEAYRRPTVGYREMNGWTNLQL
jgi:hypothetical protein